jgi:hypothetical protein
LDVVRAFGLAAKHLPDRGRVVLSELDVQGSVAGARVGVNGDVSAIGGDLPSFHWGAEICSKPPLLSRFEPEAVALAGADKARGRTTSANVDRENAFRVRDVGNCMEPPCGGGAALRREVDIVVATAFVRIGCRSRHPMGVAAFVTRTD